MAKRHLLLIFWFSFNYYSTRKILRKTFVPDSFSGYLHHLRFFYHSHLPICTFHLKIIIDHNFYTKTKPFWKQFGHTILFTSYHLFVLIFMWPFVRFGYHCSSSIEKGHFLLFILFCFSYFSTDSLSFFILCIYIFRSSLSWTVCFSLSP